MNTIGKHPFGTYLWNRQKYLKILHTFFTFRFYSFICFRLVTMFTQLMVADEKTVLALDSIRSVARKMIKLVFETALLDIYKRYTRTYKW